MLAVLQYIFHWIVERMYLGALSSHPQPRVKSFHRQVMTILCIHDPWLLGLCITLFVTFRILAPFIFPLLGASFSLIRMTRVLTRHSFSTFPTLLMKKTGSARILGPVVGEDGPKRLQRNVDHLFNRTFPVKLYRIDGSCFMANRFCHEQIFRVFSVFSSLLSNTCNCC